MPFLTAFMVTFLYFDLSIQASVFVGLTMTATAVVVTLKILRDLGLHNTRMARVIVASCVLDDLFTLILFSVVLGVINDGTVSVLRIFENVGKAILFFGVVIGVGHWLYPLFKHPFRNRDGKGFAFILILSLAFGLLADMIGLHIIIGAYLAGLFFREEVASKELIQKVTDRLDGIAYTFLGPIFFISLGFEVTFDALVGKSLWFVLVLTGSVYIIQVISAGGMARLLRFTRIEATTVGVGMCGRAEMAFVLASLGLGAGIINNEVFSVLIFTAFILNILTPVGLWACAWQLNRTLHR